MRHSRSLQFRLAVLLSIAVAPAAVFAVISSLTINSNTRAFKHAAIDQVATLIAEREHLRLEKAAEVIEALVNRPLAGNQNACSELVETAQAITNDIQDLAVLRGNNQVVCSTREAAAAPDAAAAQAVFTRTPRSQGKRSFTFGREETLIAIEYTPAGGDPLIIFGWVRNRLPDLLVDEAFSNRGLEVALVTEDGDVIGNVSASNEVLSAWDRAGDSLDSADGELLYAYAPIFGGVAGVLVGGMREQLFGSERWQLWSSLTTSLATLLIVIGTAWVGVNKLVVRWISKLRGAAASYAIGDLSVRVADVDKMPVGIAEFATTFNKMADAIYERSSELEDSVLKQSHLLRELHHRVKNNFQVMGSLLALQKRSLDPEKQSVLLFSEERIQAMATAYRVAYANGEIGSVPMGTLIDEVSEYLCRHSGRPVDCMKFDDRTDAALDISLDQAIPLAFLLTEILSPAIRTSTGDNWQDSGITLSEGDAKTCKIRLIVPKAPHRSPDEEKLHERLRKAFELQLDATLVQHSAEEQVCWTISFVRDDSSIATQAGKQPAILGV